MYIYEYGLGQSLLHNLFSIGNSNASSPTISLRVPMSGIITRSGTMLGATLVGGVQGLRFRGLKKVETENQAEKDMDNEMETGMCRIYAD